MLFLLDDRSLRTRIGIVPTFKRTRIVERHGCEKGAKRGGGGGGEGWYAMGLVSKFQQVQALFSY